MNIIFGSLLYNFPVRKCGLIYTFVHRFCQDNEVADEHFDPHQVTGPMFLHEVGGNIGEEGS